MFLAQLLAKRGVAAERDPLELMLAGFATANLIEELKRAERDKLIDSVRGPSVGQVTASLLEVGDRRRQASLRSLIGR